MSRGDRKDILTYLPLPYDVAMLMDKETVVYLGSLWRSLSACGMQFSLIYLMPPTLKI
jgi:hypothetical protein